MATEDGRAHIWYADGSGNVTGYTETVGEIAGTIIDAYNEHFGTDISIWTPETKTLQVGDTIPNWNAYEKIEMPQSYIMLSGEFIDGNPFGIIENNIFKVSSKTQSNCWLCSSNGEIVTDINLGQTSKEEILYHIQHYFPDVDSIVMFVEDFSIGDSINVTDYPWPE